MRLVLALLTVLLLALHSFGGDVTAQLKNGSVIIEGSSGNDDVRLGHGGLGAGNVRVASVGGTVNGSGTPVDISGFSKDVIVKLSTGNDKLVVESMTVHRDLRVTAAGTGMVFDLVESQMGRDLRYSPGNGAAQLNMYGALDIGRHMRVNMGNTSNVIFSQLNQSCQFHGGKLSVRCGSGADSVNLGTMMGLGGSSKIRLGDGAGTLVCSTLWMDGKLKVRMGKGADTLDMAGVVAGGGARIDALDGANSLYLAGAEFWDDLRLGFGSGFDSVSLDTLLVVGKTEIQLGDESNDLYVAGSIFDKEVKVTGGKGNDSVVVQSLNCGSDVTMMLGDGNNGIELPLGLVGGDLYLKTGSGDDDFDLAGITVDGTTTIKPGGGNNTGL